MSVETKITERNIAIREATTRYINITCKDKETGNPFDFSNYTVRTHLAFGSRKRYVPTTIINSMLSYKIPADISLGMKAGVAETRIFDDNNDVFEVLRINIAVAKANQPDLVAVVI